MSWTTPADLRHQVQKLWNRGLLPAQLVGGAELFPRRLSLKGPGSKDLSERFEEVRKWIGRLEGDAMHYRVVRRHFNHRILGSNAVPAEIWVDSLEDALSLIGRRREAQRLAELAEETRKRMPQLLPWLLKRPLRALELAEEWSRLLDIVHWQSQNPHPGIYVRQVEIAGVHSKFIEAHRPVLAELFDLILPADAVDTSATGVSGFYRRYGFRERPHRVRFRLLDPGLSLLPTGTDQDLTVTAECFARLNLPVERIFVTENEINFLAFPPVPRSMVVFGAGYGFDHLFCADWMSGRTIYYWGDLDTHGFAILEQLRAHYPQAASFLMDRQTLLAHRTHWGVEPQPETRDLSRLTGEESALYDDLRRNRIGQQVRLEQEKIGFKWLIEAIRSLGGCWTFDEPAANPAVRPISQLLFDP